jgi:RNA polymerase-binding transcription factor DksA
MLPSTNDPAAADSLGPDGRDVRRRLLEERARTRTRLAQLTGDYRGIVDASRDSNADDEHDPEGATIAFERSQVGALVLQARERIDEVDAALRRLDTGEHGRCETCGRAIPEDRLMVRPTARTCVGC